MFGDPLEPPAPRGNRPSRPARATTERTGCRPALQLQRADLSGQPALVDRDPHRHMIRAREGVQVRYAVARDRGRNVLLTENQSPGVIAFEGTGIGCCYDDLAALAAGRVPDQLTARRDP